MSGIALSLACNKPANPSPKISVGTSTTINLRAITGFDEVQTFNEVKQARLLPAAVLAEFGSMADPGEAINIFDIPDPNLPSFQLKAAAVSKQYCIVSYWAGGIALQFRTTIFELSGDKAKIIWVSNSQGGFNFLDLKGMVESGRMHNDLPHHPR